MAKITTDIIGEVILNCGLPPSIKYMTYSHNHNEYDRETKIIYNTHYILFDVLEEILVLGYDEETARLWLLEDDSVYFDFDIKQMILNPIEHYRHEVKTFIVKCFDKIIRDRKEIG
jgi:hypothetical protein